MKKPISYIVFMGLPAATYTVCRYTFGWTREEHNYILYGMCLYLVFVWYAIMLYYADTDAAINSVMELRTPDHFNAEIFYSRVYGVKWTYYVYVYNKTHDTIDIKQFATLDQAISYVNRWNFYEQFYN